MNAIILSAGQGSRLNMNIPKCMLTLGDNLLIERTLTVLRNISEIDEIIIVIGNNGVWNNKYQNEIENIAKKYNSISVINTDSLNSQSVESLKLGINKFDSLNDTLVIDGDLAFDTNIINTIIKIKTTSILINQSLKGSKVIFSISNDIKILQEISENTKSNYAYSGIMMIMKDDILKFNKILEHSNYKNKIMAHFLNDCINSIDFNCILINECNKYSIQGNIFNINTKNDLSIARRVLL